MTNYWLLKTEPSTYSFDRLVAEGTAVWDGVRNNLALKYLREMKSGDRVLVYHSGAEKAVVGQARVTRAAYADPTRDDPKLVVVDLAPGARLPHPVPLAAIKQDPQLAELPLVRMSRLSVMPVAPEHWKRLLELAAGR
ncbi:MAG: EVE domain-containing protein [Gemmatimonadetes bacterium]|nr:EVE domain-containing protein [Gemmatimonadota bacterium]MBP6670938.1 EVE domain-containing protein [Gemmatimonadales bacterium]MBK6779526.1 EVE domain-containing protein [Gemmatimonadota bacterium]MBK7350247.1 EVE domain-containing protein [Gemmatimonadota bacterium]MBK7716233.1 EVE domain-containing protein [Gemmatimonadota bacterium]